MKGVSVACAKTVFRNEFVAETTMEKLLTIINEWNKQSANFASGTFETDALYHKLTWHYQNTANMTTFWFLSTTDETAVQTSIEELKGKIEKKNCLSLL